jgi:hypothetical protein
MIVPLLGTFAIGSAVTAAPPVAATIPISQPAAPVAPAAAPAAQTPTTPEPAKK